jgi:hypothetical protein
LEGEFYWLRSGEIDWGSQGVACCVWESKLLIGAYWLFVAWILLCDVYWIELGPDRLMG